MGDVNGLFVASGQGFADALAAAPIAAKKGYGILLAESSGVSPQSQPYVKGKEVVIVGGEAVLSSEVERSLSGAANVTRLSGSNRYDTLAKLLWNFSSDNKGETVLVSTGENFPDALVLASLAVHNDAPLVLVGNGRNGNVETFLMAYTNDVRVNNVAVVGGPSVINDTQISNIVTKVK
jgi:putative cell wall-binding protein